MIIFNPLKGGYMTDWITAKDYARINGIPAAKISIMQGQIPENMKIVCNGRMLAINTSFVFTDYSHKRGPKCKKIITEKPAPRIDALINQDRSKEDKPSRYSLDAKVSKRRATALNTTIPYEEIPPEATNKFMKLFNTRTPIAEEKDKKKAPPPAVHKKAGPGIKKK